MVILGFRGFVDLGLFGDGNFGIVIDVRGYVSSRIGVLFMDFKESERE